MFLKGHRGAFSTGLFFLIFSVCSYCSEGTSPDGRDDKEIPYLRRAGSSTQLIVEGKPFVMLAGEVHNSSSSNLDYMRGVWGKLAGLNLNTVLVPVSWQLVEPEEGKFDFRLVDGLIESAREHNLRLVLLWFGSWKNTISCYVPDWVKRDTNRFRRIKRDSPYRLRERWGFGSKPEVLSPFCREACEADKRAFAALMRHIREVDGDRHTVIMVQVENETGLLGDSRDRSDPAEEAFFGEVPKELLQYLFGNKESLLPEVREIWAKNGFRTEGTWTEVFGEGPYTDEIFMAWYIGRYVNEIAMAGKEEYPLPMLVNAWLINEELEEPAAEVPSQIADVSGSSIPLEELPGEYPSGGPVSKMMDVWRAAAPSIDLLAPDIYLSNFKYICTKYTRSCNPLLIPEANRATEPERKVIYAVAEHDAIGFAPFGVDNKSFPSSHPLGESYKLLASVMDIITNCHGTERMRGFLEGDEKSTIIEIGEYRFEVDYYPFYMTDKGGRKGCGFIISLSDNEFIIFGLDCSVKFGSNNEDLPHAAALSVEESRYENGIWIGGRVLNGDETEHGTAVGFPSELRAKEFPIRKVRLYLFE